MFTGLVEQTGTIASLGKASGATRIRVSAPGLASQLKEGDSIAVSGVCLTALSPDHNTFEADLAQETIARTSLSCLAPGALVNLELPTPAGTPLGGHVVQGHVDGTGRLVLFELTAPGREDRWLEIEIPQSLTRYVVEKGSITVEGISLTVAAIAGTHVTIAIIPHTYQATNLRTLKPGDPVNVEVDVLARYAEKQRRTARSWTVEELVSRGF
ncbi:MAG TPA: riboflavin synthase [Terriglobales bacterium]|jgi:riboflavin synthase|nr:riboflavin synthase [Terriglobales bacterium]